MGDTPVPPRTYVIHGDITRTPCDAIINPTGHRIDCEAGLTRALCLVGGSVVERAFEEAGDIPLGGLVPIDVTGSNLQTELVITVGIWGEAHERPTEQLVRTALDKCIQYAGSKGLRTIALPAMGAAYYTGLSPATAARVMLEVLHEHEKTSRLPSTVFLVLFQRASYHEFMRQLGRPTRAMNVPDGLAEDFADGKGVVFVGPTPSKLAGAPSWQVVVTALSRHLHIDRQPGEDIVDLAERINHLPGSDTITSRLICQFFRKSEARPTVDQINLASLRARNYFTTNYDDLLEQALEIVRRDYDVVLIDASLKGLRVGETAHVVKLHGDVRTGRSIVLARSDWGDVFNRHPAIAHYMEGLLVRSTFLLVGYHEASPTLAHLLEQLVAPSQMYGSRIFVAVETTPGIEPKFPPILSHPTITVIRIPPAQSLRTWLYALVREINVRRLPSLGWLDMFRIDKDSPKRSPMAEQMLAEAFGLVDQGDQRGHDMLVQIEDLGLPMEADDWIVAAEKMVARGKYHQALDALARAYTVVDPSGEDTVLKKIERIHSALGDDLRAETYAQRRGSLLVAPSEEDAFFSEDTRQELFFEGFVQIPTDHDLDPPADDSDAEIDLFERDEDVFSS